MGAHRRGSVGGDSLWWQHTRRIARVNTGEFDMLHHAANDDGCPVANRVDIRLDCILEERVNQHRPIFTHTNSTGEVIAKRGLLVHDLHGAPAKHVARPDEHGIPNPIRGLNRPFHTGRRAVRRLRDVELARNLLKATTILGDVNRVG